MKIIKTISHTYNHFSVFGKILLFVTIFLILVVFFRYINETKNMKREGFSQQQEFLFKKGSEIYDDFYVSIYDDLVFNPVKNDYEVSMIINKNVPNAKSVILDVGSGTGHHVAKLAETGLEVLGLDNSPSMIELAKKNYPEYNFTQGNVLNTHEFQNNTFTHIVCLYFTLYYLENKQQFFLNCMEWLKPGGYLIVHLVDREKFDPILPPGNPLYIVSPQKYAKKRITHTKVHFHDFVYHSDFKLQDNTNVATFEEKFQFPDGKVRKQEHKLYMDTIGEIVNMAQDAGFIIQEKIDLVKVAYEYQYLYVFVKP